MHLQLRRAQQLAVPRRPPHLRQHVQPDWREHSCHTRLPGQPTRIRNVFRATIVVSATFCFGLDILTNVPNRLVLHVPRLWNQDNPAQVKWDYGNYRNMPAFTDNPFGNAYASTYRIPSVFKTGDREGSYTVGRAGFICK